MQDKVVRNKSVLLCIFLCVVSELLAPSQEKEKRVIDRLRVGPYSEKLRPRATLVTVFHYTDSP